MAAAAARMTQTQVIKELAGSTGTSTKVAKHCCAGKNSCKNQGGCGADKGKNDCSGKGGCSTYKAGCKGKGPCKDKS